MNLANDQSLPLPPGDAVQLLELEQADRNYLLKSAQAWGPIFKGLSGSHLCVCIVGLPLGRQFLHDHGDALRPVTLELDSLFPRGFMRQMREGVHKKYRGILVNAIRSQEQQSSAGFAPLVAHYLAEYCRTQDQQRRPAGAYIGTLKALVTSMLIDVFFAARPGSPLHDELVQGFAELGPFGLAWTIGPKQTAAFARLRSALRAHPWTADEGLMGQIIGADALDDTMLGNLIYMVEMGRFDMASYFRWLTWHALNNPLSLEAIRQDPNPHQPGIVSRAEAFALETLRLDQSERLLRKAERDIGFQGFHIPESATVRICLWESHKSPDAFASPFTFNEDRFLKDPPSADIYSPFGLDRHRCPFADLAIKLASAFTRTLAEQYRLELVADSEAVRGPYHWEPGIQFAVRLSARSES